MAVLYCLADGVSESARHRIEIPGESSVLLADLLAAAFGLDAASGGVLVGATTPLMLSSRTYNDTPNGTFGQYVPVSAESELVRGNERATLIQLTRNRDYRTNIGFTNLRDDLLDVTVEAYRAGGSFIGSRVYQIDPYSFYQVTDILRKLGAESVDDAYAVVRSPSLDAAYATYATIIDNRTGDPIYASPAEPSAEPVYIAAAAHLRGANQTNWRTDLEVFNSGSTQARFQIDLIERNRDNSASQNRMFLLGPGMSVRYEDVLDSLFAYSGAAALRITPIEGEIAATSRTYNLFDEGTTGQFAPAAGMSLAITPEHSGRLIQLTQSAQPRSGYRTNIGFTSLSSRSTGVNVDLYDNQGNLLGRVGVDLDPYEFTQLDKIFTRVTADAVDNGYAVISTESDGATFLAYASVIDNRSGDPIYIPARGWTAPDSETEAASVSTGFSPSAFKTLAAACSVMLMFVVGCRRVTMLQSTRHDSRQVQDGRKPARPRNRRKPACQPETSTSPR
jgi:hypothetical protein